MAEEATSVGGGRKESVLIKKNLIIHIRLVSFSLQGPGELETDFMIPTFLQTWVLTFNTLLGLLLAFSFWGKKEREKTRSVLC